MITASRATTATTTRTPPRCRWRRAARTAEWVEQRLDTNRPASFALTFFGGEPLLNLPVLFYLSERLSASCAARGVTMTINIITNGLLLTPDVVDRLVPLGLNGVKVTQALELHMEIEERDIYPVVQRVVGKEEAEEAGIEHRLAREGLAEVRRLVDEPGFGAAVAMLTAGIRHHVKEEETEVFPELKKKIDREELSELGDRVAAAKKPKRRTAAAA